MVELISVNKQFNLGDIVIVTRNGFEPFTSDRNDAEYRRLRNFADRVTRISESTDESSVTGTVLSDLRRVVRNFRLDEAPVTGRPGVASGRDMVAPPYRQEPETDK